MNYQFQAIKTEKKENILTITIDHPPTNAVNAAIHTDLRNIFPMINNDPETRVVVITGAGERAFSAGGDVHHMVELLDDHQAAIASMKEAQELLYGLLRLEKPLIARVNGHAIGLGATLALFSDLIYAVETAKIGDPHVRVGYAAGDGGALIWPQMIGYARAREYLLTGEPLLAKEAAQIGLINRAVPLDSLDDLVYGMARRLAAGPTVAINSTKQAINLVLRRQFEGLIEVHSALELVSHFSADHAEAARAFLEKREPVFTGR
ncbi:crotonase/enoyl-CoA hydratase family protein (plasmid) [Rhizobium gallicum]|uniref:Crotonase/enoyl-CoA hydratase family protein n=1 Tax=Rhizobium gallicum TaxID=56730 RepID=A0A1L5NS32_9HYPH|nr:enoyl-CoA hydratase-related protein [Rhizobium gallicum]APO70697.1 crotonase/enoyl-CoA hydratase family protein [Rhizobium gallicum]